MDYCTPYDDRYPDPLGLSLVLRLWTGEGQPTDALRYAQLYLSAGEWDIWTTHIDELLGVSLGGLQPEDCRTAIDAALARAEFRMCVGDFTSEDAREGDRDDTYWTWGVYLEFPQFV